MRRTDSGPRGRPGERGMALVVAALVSVAVGILLVVVGVLLASARRAQARLEGSLREVRCQADLHGRAMPVLEAAGWPVVEDPALAWTAPPGRGGALDLGDARLRVVPAGDEAFVYLDVGGSVRCVGDRMTP